MLPISNAMKEKKILSDVVIRNTAGRRPLSDVIQKSDHRQQTPIKKRDVVKPAHKQKEVDYVVKESTIHRENSTAGDFDKTKSLVKKTAWVSIPIGIILVVYLVISILFSGAELKITPKSEQLEISASLNAKKGDSKTSFIFETVSLSEEGSKLVASTGTKDVSEKATGRVVIYNAYSTATQKLIKDTRLETTDGKIYRIVSSVVVPGLKTVSGETIPGSVEVSVFADKPGEQYNIGLADFTITGFKGDPRYSKFYARSKGEIKGGYVGSVQVASPDAVNATRNELRTAIKDSLLRQISSQIPESFVLFKEASEIIFETKDDLKNESGVIVKEKGTYTGILLPKNLLSKEILKKANYLMKDVDATTLKNTENLVFMFDGANDSLLKATSISFTLKGTATVEALVDIEKLKKDIAGKQRSDFNKLLADYKGIKTATLSMNPFWARYIPTNEEKITIIQGN